MISRTEGTFIATCIRFTERPVDEEYVIERDGTLRLTATR